MDTCENTLYEFLYKTGQVWYSFEVSAPTYQPTLYLSELYIIEPYLVWTLSVPEAPRKNSKHFPWSKHRMSA